ncbi:MAG: NAD-dependent protein deacylase [Ruminococcaceae bacterium]|nr:NAD-dependent protein deacylase [Oscillospiraceae bacterium]
MNKDFLKEKTEKLNEILKSSKSTVFFGGAGVSTESGIPDFRSVDGLYNQKYDYPPETILSGDFFYSQTEEFYRFYRDKMLCLTAMPNAAHLKLAEMEQKGKLSAIITQNIDGLHQKAGSKRVYELHGSVLRNYCLKCGKSFTAEYILKSKGVPRCDCGGLIKPDVVLYSEQLDQKVLGASINAIENADTLIIGGTSLVVYPAAGLINYFRGNNLVIINMSPTSADSSADLLIEGRIGEVFGQINI